MPDEIFNVPSIKAKTIKTPLVDISRIGQTGDWASINNRIDLGLSNHTKAMEDIEAKKGQDDTNLQRRINKAKAQGNEAKQARLEGKQARIDVRQKARAERIKTRNTEQLSQTQARQDKKDKKFADRREGGNVPVTSFGQAFEKFSTIAKKLI